MKTRFSFKHLPENAIFWLLLFSLAVGCGTSLAGKLREKSREKADASSLLPAAAVSEIRPLTESSLFTREQALELLRSDPDFHILLPPAIDPQP